MEFNEYITFEELFSIPLRNGVSKPKRVRGSGYPMVNMGELFSHDRIHDIEMDLVPLTDKEKSAALLQHNDLLFARQSLVLSGAGKCSIFLGHNPLTTFESHLIRVRLNDEIASPLFYYYYFKSYKGRQTIESIVEQVAAAGIRGSDLKKIKVPFPKKTIQDKIASILKRIDEQIEINESIILNLEALAQTLFNRWLLDFEFLNDNKEEYKTNGGKMIESPLGNIPENWSVCALTDIADYKNGLAMQKYRPDENEKSLPVLKIRELNQGFIENNGERCKADIKDSAKVYDGDVIFSWSGTLRVKLWAGGDAGLNQHLFKVTSSNYPKWFYYYWTKYHLRQFTAIAADKATTMGHIKRSHLTNSKVIVPPEKDLSRFSITLEPIVEEIVEKNTINKKLQELRETLLPNLLSGNINLSVNTGVDNYVSFP